MAKFSGLVGYGQQVEIEPGVWDTDDKVVMMRGDLIRQNADIKTSGVNDEISLGHRVSLIGNAFAFDNYFNMKWIIVYGQKWKIASVEIQRPRIIVSLGGLWNGQNLVTQ